MSEYMEMALQLAAQWRGQTSPNPLVGAVVVKEGKIVGKGAHQKAGEPHAEVHALNDAGVAAMGSTLYVTLEPCSHYGKTPPCTERIIASGVSRVVTAMVDPNPLVAGRGIARLREAGIEVEVGDCAAEAERLNEVFTKYITTRRPFVTLKAAISLDGNIATQTGDSKWITNEQARAKVHEMRHEVDAVLVGTETVRSDNPRLDVRRSGKVRDPQKIVLTSRLMEPDVVRNLAVYQLSQEKPLVMIGIEGVAVETQAVVLKEMGVEVILLPESSDGGVNLHHLMDVLGERQITSLLLEGGSGVYSTFLQAGLVDRCCLFQAPVVLGGDGISWTQGMGVNLVQEAQRLRNVQYSVLGDNILIEGYLHNRGQRMNGM